MVTFLIVSLFTSLSVFDTEKQKLRRKLTPTVTMTEWKSFHPKFVSEEKRVRRQWSLYFLILFSFAFQTVQLSAIFFGIFVPMNHSEIASHHVMGSRKKQSLIPPEKNPSTDDECKLCKKKAAFLYKSEDTIAFLNKSVPFLLSSNPSFYSRNESHSYNAKRRSK